VNLASTLRTLSAESTASVLFTVPCSFSEDIVFQSYPQDKHIDFEELDRLISQQQTVSAKPRGDTEEAKGQRASDSAGVSKAFERRFMSKHGWSCFIIEKR